MLLLKATYAQEDKEATLKKVVPHEHWRCFRTNNILERFNREIRRRTRVVGCFPDGKSALMLVCARFRYVASKDWGTKRYLSMKYPYELENQQEIENEMKKAKKNLA